MNRYLIALIFLHAPMATGEEGHPKGGDGRGLFLRLELPWTTLLAGEKLQYKFILENASDKSVPIAIPWVKYGLGFQTGAQPFLNGKFKNGPRIQVFDENPIPKVEDAAWPPRNSEVEEPVEAWGVLPAGQRITWNQNHIRPGHYGIGTNPSLEALQAHWLVGPKRWISSKPVAVRIVAVSPSQRKMVFHDEWATQYSGLRSVTGYTVPIEGRFFLFYGYFMSRVDEVSPSDEFERRIDQEKTNIEISIKSSKGVRKLYYHLMQGTVRDTPWPIGPFSALAPQPEQIPAGELSALRLKLDGK